MSIEHINGMPDAEFVRTFGGIYESSPWVAEIALQRRPFASTDALKEAMRQVVQEASAEQQLGLIMAHPDLGGKLARRGELTSDSTREQSRLGLDRLEEDEYEQFDSLNQDYRKRFGIPFIICVGLVDKAGILEAFRRRMEFDEDHERIEALRQIHLIAAFRVAQVMDG